MKYFISLLALSVLFVAFKFSVKPTSNATQNQINQQALEFCQNEELNTEFYVLIDMRGHSGKNRLFVIDLKSNRVLMKGLCSHGCCDKEWGSDESKSNPVFSNVSGSHCSSLGKYKIGARGWSNWGIHVNYKLHGLETSNSKAYERDIVL
ncbi:MAG: murein L,D-transpeptidase catalytic domain-containing protein, partial [Bacteroidia bacterium]